jgi:hypothetical protein
MNRVMWMGVAALLVLGLGRAARFRFQEKQEAAYQACRAELQKLGLTQAAAKARFPTPYIKESSHGCLQPGSTGEVVVKGTFPPGTKFVFENDNIEVVKESVVANEYRATVKIASGIGPQSAGVVAISPSCVSARLQNAVTVGGKFEWTMESKNGWRIVARPRASQACGKSPQERAEYEMSFYRNGEAKPFERRKATLGYSMYEKTNYNFMIERQSLDSQSGMENYMALMQKMSDPKLTPAQREALMKQVQQAATAMQADMAKMTDPAYVKKQQEQEAQFGCGNMQLAVESGGNLTGEMSCGQAAGGRIGLAGTMRPVQ